MLLKKTNSVLNFMISAINVQRSWRAYGLSDCRMCEIFGHCSEVYLRNIQSNLPLLTDRRLHTPFRLMTLNNRKKSCQQIKSRPCWLCARVKWVQDIWYAVFFSA